MEEALTTFKNSRLGIIVFILTLIITLYWGGSHIIDVYQYPLMGAIYEIVWIFAVLLILVLPVISLVLWIKEKGGFRSLYLYSFLLGIATILLMFL